MQVLTQDNHRLNQQINMERQHQNELEFTMASLREDIRQKDQTIEELEEEIGGGHIETVVTHMGTAGNFERQHTGGMKGSILQ